MTAPAVTTRPKRLRRAQPTAPLLIAGTPGSGRTTRARAMARPYGSLTIMQPALALLEGGPEWARRFEVAMQHDHGAVCVDGIDLIAEDLLDLVMGYVGRPGRPILILTSGPVDSLTGRAAALAATAIDREELLPLAARPDQVPGLAAAMLRELAPDRPIHLSEGLMRTLAAQPWQGNLHELRAVLTHLADHRQVGGLTSAELPARYRCQPSEPMLNARDRAERAVIIAALRAVSGNKVRASEELCMSRTTLYARMRSLKITRY